MIFFLFIFNLFVLIGIVAVGLSLVSWAYVQVFGFSPTAWELTLPYCIYLVLGVAADMAFFGLLLSLFAKKKRMNKEKNPGSFRLISTIIFFLIGFVAVLYGVIFPSLERTLGGSGWLGGMQKGGWPGAIGLADFHVCAREIRYGLTNKKMGKGPIRFEIVNRSPVLLKEATFTILAGHDTLTIMGEPDKFHRFVVRNMKPGECRRIERDVDFGVIMVYSTGGLPMYQRGAKILCERVRFEGSPVFQWEKAQKKCSTTINDCPDLSIEGFWVATDGARLDIIQQGEMAAGSISEGPFSSFPNPLKLKREGAGFSGSFSMRAGREISASGALTLTPSGEDRLTVKWTLKDTSGTTRGGDLEFIRRGKSSLRQRSTLYQDEMFKMQP